MEIQTDIYSRSRSNVAEVDGSMKAILFVLLGD